MARFLRFTIGWIRPAMLRYAIGIVVLLTPVWLLAAGGYVLGSRDESNATGWMRQTGTVVERTSSALSGSPSLAKFKVAYTDLDGKSQTTSFAEQWDKPLGSQLDVWLKPGHSPQETPDYVAMGRWLSLFLGAVMGCAVLAGLIRLSELLEKRRRPNQTFPCPA